MKNSKTCQIFRQYAVVREVGWIHLDAKEQLVPFGRYCAIFSAVQTTLSGVTLHLQPYIHCNNTATIRSKPHIDMSYVSTLYILIYTVMTTTRTYTTANKYCCSAFFHLSISSRLGVMTMEAQRLQWVRLCQREFSRRRTAVEMGPRQQQLVFSVESPRHSWILQLSMYPAICAAEHMMCYLTLCVCLPPPVHSNITSLSICLLMSHWGLPQVMSCIPQVCGST